MDPIKLVYIVNREIMSNNEGKIQWAVIEWACACRERRMEIDTNKSKTKHITKEYRED